MESVDHYTLQDLTEKAFGGPLVLTLLDNNIDYIIVLIHCTPQMAPVALSRDNRHFIHVPRIPKSSLPFAQLVRVSRTEFQAPLPDQFATNDDTTLGRHVFNIGKTQTKSMIQPHCATYDFRRYPVATIP
jgi:hypothetical protein